MWRWGRNEAQLDAETVSGIIRLLMRIDANVQRLLVLEGEDGTEEEDES